MPLGLVIFVVFMFVYAIVLSFVFREWTDRR
jgi:hypothetical protein